jgi:hypothetical protein
MKKQWLKTLLFREEIELLPEADPPSVSWPPPPPRRCPS